jgi:transposase
MPDRYPTDLSDAEWAALEPLLPPPARTGMPAPAGRASGRGG